MTALEDDFDEDPMSLSRQHGVDPGCGDCPLHSRREFLRDSAAVVGASLIAIGLAPRAALGAYASISARRISGTDVRYPIPAGDGAHIDAEQQVIVARAAGAVYAFALACPHQRTALRWEPARSRFRCPKHKSTFGTDGAFISGRATRPMDRYPIRRDNGSVVVDVRSALRFDRDRPAWESAVVRLAEK